MWNYIKQLFQGAADSTPADPVVHEMIVRSEEEKQDYAYWKDTLVRRRLVDWLADQFAIFQILPNDLDSSIDFLNTPSSKGFVIYFQETQYSKRDVFHFFDYLKEQVLALNYRTQISDYRTYNRPNWVETAHRHYLKPRKTFVKQEKMEQAYGNVTIEVVLRNDVIHHLKLRATVYKDHQFKEAKDFKSFMQAIL